MTSIRIYITLIICLLLSQGGKAQNISDALDGILSIMTDDGVDLDRMAASMAGEPDFDSMISAMSSPSSSSATVDLDLLAASMSRGGSRYSDAAVRNTLSFLSDAYSYPAQGRAGYFRGYSNPSIAGGAVLPVAGIITSRFGYRPAFRRMHKGVDIALQVGDTVVAALDGTVERVSNDPHGYGVFVCLRHSDGMETRYAHLSRALVVPGMRVMAGEPLALGGNTGNSTGPHLHFETRVQGTAVDPTSMFDFSMPSGMTRHRSLAALDSENPRHAVNMYPASYGSANPAAGAALAQREKSTYIVRTGDTVASVARKNGISVLTLCRLNMLSSDSRLTPGTMLKIR
ncbi:MAG: peptidoglycan DD-metalloendopeptidase family protein [Muribaculaceae bacterium]|nr:peptidoglycan DD-metalloendopeptidase family protein [Muribaculaceae bacterium]